MYLEVLHIKKFLEVGKRWWICYELLQISVHAYTVIRVSKFWTSAAGSTGN